MNATATTSQLRMIRSVFQALFGPKRRFTSFPCFVSAWLFWALHAIGWVGMAEIQAAVSIKTQLDRDSIMVGETANLTISVEGGSPRSIEGFPENPTYSIQYRGTSQSTTMINGSVSSKHMLNFIVQGLQPGQSTIPSVRVTVDNAAYPTDPVQLTVTKTDVPANNRYAFLKLNVPKKEIYIGEVLPIEVQLYVTEAENLQTPQLKSDGFVIHKQLEPARSQTQIGNMIYNVLSFKLSVSAAKAGALTLGPAETSFVLRIRAQPDPNDLFGGVFGRYQRRQVSLASPTLDIKVLPLPGADAPQNFGGAIGNFTWQVSAGPTSLTAGDPVTMTVVVTGRGNLDNLKLADVTWPDFKLYPPNTSIAPQDALGLAGSKTFEQVVVPQSAAVREIPQLSLTYFDPEQKRYIQLTQPAIPLTVRPAAGGQAVPTVIAGKNKNEAEEQADRTDIVHIKMDPGLMVAGAAPLLRKPWFIILQMIPLAGFVGVTVWRKRRDALANNPRLRRKLETGRIVQAGLAQLRQHAAANDSDAFFALVFRLLQEQLGERLDQPASAITEAAIDERLPRRGAAPDLVVRLHQLFQTCNQARYAPVRSHEELQAVAANLETALAELQQLPD